MWNQKIFWYKLAALFLLLTLTVPVLFACGGGEEETHIATPAATTTATTPMTATPTSSEPVKIGVISEWSGPFAISGVLVDQAIAVVEWRVKNMGGILGGREIKFIKGDDGGVLAQSVALAKKMVLEDNVTILTVGGISVAHFTAVAQAAEELKVPYVSPASIYGVPAMKYSVSPTSNDSFIIPIASYVIDVLKPKTVAWLGYELEDSHVVVNGGEGSVGLRDRFKAKGIDMISEQYFPVDVVDLSPYIARIKRANPDVLISFLNGAAQSVTLNKQIAENGGWGNIKYLAGSPPSSDQVAVKLPSAVGTYALATWLPGIDVPGMKAFEDGYMQVYGRLPNTNVAALYNPIWIAIKGIEFAGTDDPEQVAKALRSGNFECDTAWGTLHMPSTGRGDITLTISQVQEGGKLVKVWPQ